jgi:hypothetical protein
LFHNFIVATNWKSSQRRSTALPSYERNLCDTRLVPNGVPDSAKGAEVIKRLLSNLGTLGNGPPEFRGLYGSGHGKHANASGLKPRHAKLALAAASSLASFLFETHLKTK